MAKFSITSPLDRDRVQANASLNIDFLVESFNTGTKPVTITIKIASKKDFSDAITINPGAQLKYFNGSSFVPYPPGNNVITNHNAYVGKTFRYTYAYPNVNDVRYIKIVNTEDNITYESTPVLVSSIYTLDFTVDPIVLQEMPFKVKVADKKTEINPANLTYHVEVCNNALDTNPTWEDATAAYLSGGFHEFVNKQKIDVNWAIGVKITVTKSVFSAGVEFSEIYVAHV